MLSSSRNVLITTRSLLLHSFHYPPLSLLLRSSPLLCPDTKPSSDADLPKLEQIARQFEAGRRRTGDEPSDGGARVARSVFEMLGSPGDAAKLTQSTIAVHFQWSVRTSRPILPYPHAILLRSADASARSSNQHTRYL
jgi:hypothetical protein